MAGCVVAICGAAFVWYRKRRQRKDGSAAPGDSPSSAEKPGGPMLYGGPPVAAATPPEFGVPGSTGTPREMPTELAGAHTTQQRVRRSFTGAIYYRNCRTQMSTLLRQGRTTEMGIVQPSKCHGVVGRHRKHKSSDRRTGNNRSTGQSVARSSASGKFYWGPALFGNLRELTAGYRVAVSSQ